MRMGMILTSIGMIIGTWAANSAGYEFSWGVTYAAVFYPLMLTVYIKLFVQGGDDASK